MDITLILSYLSRSLADRWGTTVDFTTSLLHSSRFSVFRSSIFHSRPYTTTENREPRGVECNTDMTWQHKGCFNGSGMDRVYTQRLQLYPAWSRRWGQRQRSPSPCSPGGRRDQAGSSLEWSPSEGRLFRGILRARYRSRGQIQNRFF